uniref:Uncharacterized protein n=1 Tax=Anguilla anguilla TaxID=7936 RepID=A0A0E9SZA3_ANGAN
MYNYGYTLLIVSWLTLPITSRRRFFNSL